MRVMHVAASDSIGGACRAANRLHIALQNHGESYNIESTCRVIYKGSSDQAIKGGAPKLSIRGRINYNVKTKSRSLFLKLFQKDNSSLQSIAWPSTGLGNELNKLQAGRPDVINLHWLGNDTISIEEIGKLDYPLIWRLPDEWAFSGAEHYVSTSDKSYHFDYSSEHDFSLNGLFDLNYLTWRRKQKSWSKKMIHIVAPSNWVANNAKRSYLMQNWPIHVVPTPLDCTIWKPLNSAFSKQALGLDPDNNFILFGALGGLEDPRKGGDLLVEALSKLSSFFANKNYSLLIFGQEKPNNMPQLPIPFHFLGNLSDQYSLRLAYNAASLMIIPSIQDNLPGTGLEAHACGLPIVCFDVGGLADIVDDHLTGRLVQSLNADSLAQCLKEILADFAKLEAMSLRSREKALFQWDAPNVVSRYAHIYKSALEQYSPIER